MQRMRIRFFELGHARTGAWMALILALAGLMPRPVFAQGTLEDYQRAQRFLAGNLRHLVSAADVRPNWIEKTNRFWYRKGGPKGTEFILVDAANNTSEPAFDHARLAAALSRVSKHEYQPTELPLEELELGDAKAIRFRVAKALWTCTLSDYQCKESPPGNPNQALSPDKKWAAYVEDHNLYVRNVSTGAVSKLTEDGIRSWDYATPLPSLRLLVEQGTEDVRQPPAVFWSPDSRRVAPGPASSDEEVPTGLGHHGR